MIRRLFVFLVFLASVSFAAPSLSIIAFDDLSGENESPFFSHALAAMLASDLTKAKGIVVVEREHMEAVFSEIELSLTGMVDDESAAQIGEMLGAQYLITGNFLISGNEAVVTVKGVEVETARLAFSESVTTDATDALGAKNDVARALFAAMKNEFPKATFPSVPQPQVELSPEDANRYGRALALRLEQKYGEAEALLQELTKNAPAFGYAKEELAALRTRIDAYDKAREAALREVQQGPLTYESFMRVSMSYASSMKYTSLLDYARMVRDNPPDAPEGSTITAHEFAWYYIVFTLNSLKRYDAMIPEAEAFMQTYPTSIYYGAVRSFLTQASAAIRSRDRKMKSAQTESAELIAQAKNADEPQRSNLYFQIGTIYYNAELYPQARRYYDRIDIAALEELGITGDYVIYMVFNTYYGEQDKVRAERTLRSLELFYPDSAFIDTLLTMVSVIPE